MNKKNILILIIVVVAVIGITMLVYRNNKNFKVEAPSQMDVELNNAIKSDDTKSINDNLNKIDTSDTLDQDLKSIDEDLKNL